jgi:hypothetical protein
MKGKTKNHNPRRVRALKYAARGFRVLPMHPVREGHCGCSKGKACDRPAKLDGRELVDIGKVAASVGGLDDRDR